MKEATQIDVLVIGAGFSGIAAAKVLHEHKLSFLVLEARDRLGGRVYTKKFENGLYLDFGGQWIGTHQDRMYQLCEELGQDYFETYDKGKSIQDIKGRIKSFKGLIPKLDIITLINLEWVMRKLDWMAKKVDLESPWEHPKAKLYDQITLEEFLERNSLTKNCLEVLRIAFEMILATDLKHTSLLNTLFYIKSGHDLDTLVNVKNGAQYHRLKGGMQVLIEKMAEPFRSKIIFEHPVKQISQEDSMVKVSGDGFEFFAKKVILAIPPVVQQNIHFQPALPEEKHLLISKMFMGKAGKCFLLYERPFWREKGFNGQAIADSSRYFRAFFDASPPDERYGILLAFPVIEKAEHFFALHETERKELMSEIASKYFGKEALEPIAYHDFSMSSEEFSGGCYTGLYPAEAWTAFGDAYRRPFMHLHWAGTEASTVWYGYIEGAVRAGEAAASQIMTSLK